MIEYIDEALIIFFLGIIIHQSRNIKKEINILHKIAWINHPEDMKEFTNK